MNQGQSIRPSVWKFSWNWLITFFWNSAWCQRPMRCCRWQSRIFFFDPEWGKWAKIGFFQFIGKFSHYFFLNLVNKEVLYYLLYSCRNPILGKNLVLGGQNTPGQSDCMIFKLTTSLEQNDKKTWLFTCWYRFIKIKSWLKNILLCMVKNGCGHAGLRTLKIAVFQEGINEIN